MLCKPSMADQIAFPMDRGTWNENGDVWGLHGFFDTLATALPELGKSAAQIVTAIKATQAVMQLPYGGSIYSSTPAGVTPNNPYSLPSGMALPPGVTPYQQSYLPPASSGPDMTTMLLIGGAALLGIMLLMPSRKG